MDDSFFNGHNLKHSFLRFGSYGEGWVLINGTEEVLCLLDMCLMQIGLQVEKGVIVRVK